MNNEPLRLPVVEDLNAFDIAVCYCGVLMLASLADQHIEHCPVYRMTRREVEDEVE